MQMIYRARSLSDAQGARDVLAANGIAAHVGDPSRDRGTLGETFIRVSVDNARVDAARRAIRAWRAEVPLAAAAR